MTIQVGAKLGPYEILAPIGAGGMGEVWKARDTRLNRTVAIKISKQKFSDRFEREAHAVAALNHPNICTLYDVGPDYLVMEYVEGQPLQGPLPLEKAVEYAKQILEALDAAHRQGIIHRDLKPANVLVTKNGVKLLDFGLAKQASSLKESDATLTQALTGEGQIVGTLQYLSPEQLQGKEADPRSDLFAFGCVLYEMLTGKRAFEGKNAASVIAAVLEREPAPLDAAPPLDRVVRKAMAKDPDQRFQTARDLNTALTWAIEQPPPVAASPSRYRWWLAAAALLIFAALISALLYLRATAQPTRVLKVSVLPPEKGTLNGSSLLAVSPDGRRIAFAASVGGKESLWIRDLDSLTARPLQGTEGATFPFWSPDNRFLAFFADGKLKKIDIAGGPALSLCDAPSGWGGTWNKNDVIVFTPSGVGGLFRVPATGGSVSAVTTAAIAYFPWFLPDGRHFLYTGVAGKIGVYVGDIDSNSKSEARVLDVTSNAVYIRPGFLLFVRDRTLMAQPFDADKRKTTGDPVPIAEQVDIAAQPVSQFSSSQNGVLAYTSGTASRTVQLTWFERSGKVLGTLGPPGVMNWPAISPDGKTVAVDRVDPQTGLADLWLYDLARNTASRFTFGPKFNGMPVWSPDGSRIAFTSNRDGAFNVYQKATSGTAPDELLDKAPHIKAPIDWSRDGRYIIEGASDPKTKTDVWVLPLFGDRKAFPYLQTEFNDFDGKLSPNGQWLAYASDETKQFDIYVQTFPAHKGKWQVSTSGGSFPLWSRDGKELYFIGPDRKLMAVEIKAGDTFEAGTPKPLFDSHFGRIAEFPWYDVTKDGRFLIPAEVEQVGSVPITVVLNWTAGLKK